jgi:hypothetical protein
VTIVANSKGKRACLCRPTCTKKISTRQRAWHREKLRDGDIHLDSPGSNPASVDSNATAPSQASSHHSLGGLSHDTVGGKDQDQGEWSDHRSALLVENEDTIIPSDNSSLEPLQNIIEDWFSEPANSDGNSGESGHEMPSGSDHSSDEGDSKDAEFPEDDVAEEVLVRVLQERFGDQWMKELHDICAFPFSIDVFSVQSANR